MARKYPDFPIVLEAVRECLQDVYDVPTLARLMAGIAARKVRVLEVETATPSHFSAAFRKAFPAADAVVQKCVTFFLYAAADAGLKVSARILKGRKPRSLAPRRTSRRTPAAAKDVETEPPGPLPAASLIERKKPSEILFMHLDPNVMDEEQQAAIWTLLKYFKARGL